MIDGTVAILGLGLIGGSLGLALRRAGVDVVGWDRDNASVDLARARGAIDRAAPDAASAVTAANIVVVAVPVLGMRAIFTAIAPALRPGTTVTDVAGTKALVCAWAAEILPVAFVGGHPMAGSERSGMAHARADLFSGATYCLTPEPATPALAIAAVNNLIELVGARPYHVSPAAHDRAVAAISHLPFILSTALVEVTTTDPEWEQIQAIAARGYHDISRLASGDARVHRDICLTNAADIRERLLAAAKVLTDIASELDDPEALQERFDRAKDARDALYNGKVNPSQTRPLADE
jgi:prephenate dehydrogenase